MSIWHTSPCGATPIIRVVSRYHLTKQCRVIESVDSEYRPVPVASALAAHCTSFLEFDRAQKASSVGQLLFPRAPWVTARYHYYSNMRYTALYRCHQSVLYLIRAETAFALPHMPDGGMQLEVSLACKSWRLCPGRSLT